MRAPLTQRKLRGSALALGDAASVPARRAIQRRRTGAAAAAGSRLPVPPAPAARLRPMAASTGRNRGGVEEAEEEEGPRVLEPGAAPFGNFPHYSRFHSPEQRLRLLPPELLSRLFPQGPEPKPVLGLDVGCNSGVSDRGGRGPSRHPAVGRLRVRWGSGLGVASPFPQKAPTGTDATPTPVLVLVALPGPAPVRRGTPAAESFPTTFPLLASPPPRLTPRRQTESGLLAFAFRPAWAETWLGSRGLPSRGDLGLEAGVGICLLRERSRR